MKVTEFEAEYEVHAYREIGGMSDTYFLDVYAELWAVDKDGKRLPFPITRSRLSREWASGYNLRDQLDPTGAKKREGELARVVLKTRGCTSERPDGVPVRVTRDDKW